MNQRGGAGQQFNQINISLQQVNVNLTHVSNQLNAVPHNGAGQGQVNFGGGVGLQQLANNLQNLVGQLNQMVGNRAGGAGAYNYPQAGGFAPPLQQAPAAGGAGFGGAFGGNGIMAFLNQIIQLIQQLITMLAGQGGFGGGFGGGTGQGQQMGQLATQLGQVLGQLQNGLGQSQGGFGGGFGVNLNALPEMGNGAWAANHGGYEKTDNGFNINQGPLAGHTLQWNTQINAFLVFDQNGQLCGRHSSPGGEDKVASPIAFDMNDDGRIGTTSETTAKDGVRSEIGRTVNFDIDGDGQTENIEWMSGDGDALLVDNRDGLAAADMNGARLFGDQGGKFSDGYQKLSGLDANGDGKITGNELEGLDLWSDDGDGVVEAGELIAADEAGVTSISAERNDVLNARGETLMRSQAEIAGKRVMTEDVWFGMKS